jgi:hypothetical protein
VEGGEVVRRDEPSELLVRAPLLVTQPLDQALDPGVVGRGHLPDQPLERHDRDVPVAALTERVGKLLHIAEVRLQPSGWKARLEDLERGTQPPRRDAHVVDPLDVAHVQHSSRVVCEFLCPHLDDLRRGRRV